MFTRITTILTACLITASAAQAGGFQSTAISLLPGTSGPYIVCAEHILDDEIMTVFGDSQADAERRLQEAFNGVEQEWGVLEAPFFVDATIGRPEFRGDIVQLQGQIRLQELDCTPGATPTGGPAWKYTSPPVTPPPTADPFGNVRAEYWSCLTENNFDVGTCDAEVSRDPAYNDLREDARAIQKQRFEATFN